jgi:hypothetical protein
MSQAEGGQRKARGLCASVERAIGATSWPIGKLLRVWKERTGMLLAMTECWTATATATLELMRSGLGTGQERRPAFAPALLRACPYIFLESGQFCRLSSPEILDPHILHNAQGRKAHLKAHFDAPAQQHPEKVCREAKKAPQASKKRSSSTFSRPPLGLEY